MIPNCVSIAQPQKGHISLLHGLKKQSPIRGTLTQTPSPPTAEGHHMEPVLWGSSCQKCIFTGTSLMVQWLRLSAPPARGAGLIPGWRTKIPRALWRGQKKKLNNGGLMWTRFSSLKHTYIKIYMYIFSGSFQLWRQNRPSGLGVHELWLLFLTLVLYFLLLSAAPAMPVILCWTLRYQLLTGAFLKYI